MQSKGIQIENVSLFSISSIKNGLQNWNIETQKQNEQKLNYQLNFVYKIYIRIDFNFFFLLSFIDNLTH